MIRNSFLIAGLILLFPSILISSGYRSIPFDHEAIHGPTILANTRILSINEQEFILLRNASDPDKRISDQDLRVELYNDQLKRKWSQRLTLPEGQTFVSFQHQGNQVHAIYRDEVIGKQQMLVSRSFDLASGKTGDPVVLVKSRNESAGPIELKRTSIGWVAWHFDYHYLDEKPVTITGGHFWYFDSEMKQLSSGAIPLKTNLKDPKTPFLGLHLVKVNEPWKAFLNTPTKMSIENTAPADTRLKGTAVMKKLSSERVEGGTVASLDMIQKGDSIYMISLMSPEKAEGSSGIFFGIFNLISNRIEKRSYFKFNEKIFAQVKEGVKQFSKTKTALKLNKKFSHYKLTPSFLSDGSLQIICEVNHRKASTITNGRSQSFHHADDILVLIFSRSMRLTRYHFIPKSQLDHDLYENNRISYQWKRFGEELQLVTLEHYKNQHRLLLYKIGRKTGHFPEPAVLTPKSQSLIGYRRGYTTWLNKDKIVFVTRGDAKGAPYELCLFDAA